MLASQLINGIYSVFQKLLTYFNETAISFTPPFPVLPVIWRLNLNEILLLLLVEKPVILLLSSRADSSL